MISGSRWRRSNARVAIPNSSDPRWIPARLMSSCLTFFHTHSSGLSSRGVAGKEEQLQPTLERCDVLLDERSFVEGNVVENQEDGPGSIVHELLQELDEHGAVAATEEHVEVSAPPGETAEIMLTDLRSPVTSTTGVCPTGAHVVPA